MNQNQTTPETKSTLPVHPGFTLIRSHFDEAAKAAAAEQARKPTPEQIRAAHEEDLVRRNQEQSRRKSSAELIAEAERYAPGTHRACLLAAAHRREQEELAEGIAPVRPAPESAAKETAAAPHPAGELSPWGRLAARIKAEGYTAEIKAEHERLRALDAQEAAAKASDTAVPPAGFFGRLKNALDAGASHTEALAFASSGTPSPVSATAAVPDATAPHPAEETSPWDRLAARIKQEGYSESCRAEHERLEGNNAWKTTAVSPRGFFGGIIASVKSGKAQPPSDPIKFVRLMAMEQEHEASEARRQASPAKSQVAGWIRTATKKQRVAGAF